MTDWIKIKEDKSDLPKKHELVNMYTKYNTVILGYYNKDSHQFYCMENINRTESINHYAIIKEPEDA